MISIFTSGYFIMKPIIDINNTYKEFIKKNTSWCNFSMYKKNIQENISYIQYKDDTSNFSIFLKLWDAFEQVLKSLFLWKTKKRFQKLWKPFGVIIWNDILKFHDTDSRKIIRSKIL